MRTYIQIEKHTFLSDRAEKNFISLMKEQFSFSEIHIISIIPDRARYTRGRLGDLLYEIDRKNLLLQQTKSTFFLTKTSPMADITIFEQISVNGGCNELFIYLAQLNFWNVELTHPEKYFKT